MPINKETLSEAVKWANEFLKRAKELKEIDLEYSNSSSPRKAALKRTSLDLTFALAKLRRPIK